MRRFLLVLIVGLVAYRCVAEDAGNNKPKPGIVTVNPSRDQMMEVFSARVSSSNAKFKARVMLFVVDFERKELGIIFTNESGPPSGGGTCTITAAKDNTIRSQNASTGIVGVPLMGSDRSVMVRTTEFPEIVDELREREKHILKSFRSLEASFKDTVVGKN